MVTAVDTKPVSRQAIYDWLKREARDRGIEATILTHRASMSDGRLFLLVHIGSPVDAYDEVTKLQELEDSWNYREPEPHPRIFLLPADESDKPGRAKAYAPIQAAQDRYHEAFDAFRTAGSSEEAQKALKEMEDAKAAELEAARHLDRAA